MGCAPLPPAPSLSSSLFLCLLLVSLYFGCTRSFSIVSIRAIVLDSLHTMPTRNTRQTVSIFRRFTLKRFLWMFLLLWCTTPVYHIFRQHLLLIQSVLIKMANYKYGWSCVCVIKHTHTHTAPSDNAFSDISLLPSFCARNSINSINIQREYVDTMKVHCENDINERQCVCVRVCGWAAVRAI